MSGQTTGQPASSVPRALPVKEPEDKTRHSANSRPTVRYQFAGVLIARFFAASHAGETVEGQKSAKHALEIVRRRRSQSVMVEPIKPFAVRQTVRGEWRLVGEPLNRPSDNRWWCIGHMIREDLRPALTLLIQGKDRQLLVW